MEFQTKSGQKYVSIKLVLERLENELYTRIYLQRGALDRSPERFIPIPEKYFDPEFKHGFAQTEKWYKDHLAKKKRNKEWNSNARLVAGVTTFGRTQKLLLSVLSLTNEKNKQSLQFGI